MVFKNVGSTYATRPSLGVTIVTRMNRLKRGEIIVQNEGHKHKQ